MKISPWLEPGWRGDLAALLAGGALPLAFAPFGLYPLAVLSPALLFLLWLKVPPARAFRRGFLFGIGEFGVGVSWVYVAIHDFGYTAAPVAALLTLAFVAILALYPALVGWAAARLRARTGGGGRFQLLLLPALWTLGEWLRGWLFTGFPWLGLGYSQLEAPLGGLAPLLGVYGVTFAVALTAGGLVWCWQRIEEGGLGTTPVQVGFPAVVALLGWVGAGSLQSVAWTEPAGEPLGVALVQDNLPQITKWDPEQISRRLDLYAELSLARMGRSDLVVWPENAITVFYHELKEGYFAQLAQEARASGTDLLLGVPVLHEDGRQYFTTLMSLGREQAFYTKRHLVPFGEYVPFERTLRGLIAFFDLPMSGFSPGAANQPPLAVAGQKAAISICYEDAFGEEVIQALPEATLLINGSNNAWYGDSLAPHQHLQISRMRALETGRPLLRATTTGISALVDPKGRLMATSPQFETHVLEGSVQPMAGSTPFVRWGNRPVIALLFLALGAGIWIRRPG